MTQDTIAAYRALVAGGEISDDDAQRAAVEKLQIIHRRLVAAENVSALRKLFKREQVEPGDRGLYIYGGVGRGKSMLMDLFFDSIDLDAKRRVHFHPFMQEVHRTIRKVRESGSDQPVQKVAAEISAEVRLLCFDEFQVENIADAMILGQLFEALFQAEVTIVLTSNVAPDALYQDGLNRELFLPSIELIKQRLDLHQLVGPTDYRRGSDSVSRYFSPLGDAADAAMDRAWAEAIGAQVPQARTIAVGDRQVCIPFVAGAQARMEFEQLCGVALGPADYLRLAEEFEVLFLDHIPRLPPTRADVAKRFMTLIDTLYDTRRLLICSADGEPDELYPEGGGAQAFHRTASRLVEMRGASYGVMNDSGNTPGKS